MRFVFVRHGHYEKIEKGGPKNNKQPLRERGREAARAAGEFLREQGVKPDFVVTTDKKRTQETAGILLECLGGGPEPRWKGGGFRSKPASIRTKLEEWLSWAGHPPATLLFVGHDTQQDACLAHMGGGAGLLPPDNKGCVLIYDGSLERGWTLVGHFAGLE